MNSSPTPPETHARQSGPTAAAGRRADEELLVRRVQDGDLDAYDDLLRAHERPLRAYVASRIPAAHLVDELAQEAMVVAFRKIGSFKAGTDFWAWLKTIAWQLLRRERQRFASERTHRDRLSEHVRALHKLPAPEADPLIDHLEHCLARLPEGLRALLGRKYHRGESSGEIARAEQKSVEWVRINLYRARNRLRECIRRRAAHSTS